jgi:hypothetical protein
VKLSTRLLSARSIVNVGVVQVHVVVAVNDDVHVHVNDVSPNIRPVHAHEADR